jgi:chemotaxis response regulator CheB
MSKKIKVHAGAKTVAQNKEIRVVFEIPKEAIMRGAVDKVLPLYEISVGKRQFSNYN